MSLPLWECGLKFFVHYVISSIGEVTPFMGVWIEITDMTVDAWFE